MYRQHIAKKNSPSSRSTTINKQTISTPSYGSLSGTIQRAKASPKSLRDDEWLQLDSAIGTRATSEIRSGQRNSYVPEFKGISGQFQGNSGQVDAPIQKKDEVGESEVQPENKTGLPENLKAGVENLSGYSLDDVRVHYNSPKPAQLQAHAYTQGTEIHVAPGQEKHLPHETWHVVQQKQGRVKPTWHGYGVEINEDAGLEKEADRMGGRWQKGKGVKAGEKYQERRPPVPNVVQCQPDIRGGGGGVSKMMGALSSLGQWLTVAENNSQVVSGLMAIKQLIHNLKGESANYVDYVLDIGLLLIETAYEVWARRKVSIFQSWKGDQIGMYQFIRLGVIAAKTIFDTALAYLGTKEAGDHTDARFVELNAFYASMHVLLSLVLLRLDHVITKLQENQTRESQGLGEAERGESVGLIADSELEDLEKNMERLGELLENRPTSEETEML